MRAPEGTPAGDLGVTGAREMREEGDGADRWGPGAARRGERERVAAGGWDRQVGRARRARCGPGAGERAGEERESGLGCCWVGGGPRKGRGGSGLGLGFAGLG